MRFPSRWMLSLLPVLLACGESNSPDLHGPQSFTATVNGAAWTGDTAIAILFGSICDTTLLVSGVRRAAVDSTEEVTIYLHGFRGTTSAMLSDSSASAFALFSYSHDSVGAPPTSRNYWSTASLPGQLRLTGVTVDDSLVSGSFAFQGALIPDTAAHQNFSGHFRVRYVFQPVYVIGCD